MSSPPRRLPRLPVVHIATPCPARWDDMLGDEITRSCEACAKSVTNLSTMTAREVQTFLRSTAGANGCVRLLRREDGTILTRDGALGVSRRRSKNLAQGPTHLHEQIGCPSSDPLCSD